MKPRHVVGFFFPFLSSVTAGATFPQQLAIAAVSGVFGVVGVTVGAYINTRRPTFRRRRNRNP